MSPMLPTGRLTLRTKEVVRALGTSRSSLSRMVAAGQFPPPIRIGPNSIGWLADEVTAWLDARRAERDAAAARPSDLKSADPAPKIVASQCDSSPPVAQKFPSGSATTQRGR